MLKLEKILVNISYRNITHYTKLGYLPILGEELEIETTHLPSVSHVKVDVVCDICKCDNKIMYCKYLDNVKRHGFYGCKKCSRQKACLTSLDKYGVDNYSKTDEYKNRVESTNMIKFGYKTNLLNPKYKEDIGKILKEKYGTEFFYKIRNTNSIRKKFNRNYDVGSIKTELKYSEDLYDESILNNKYLLYRNECRRISVNNIKILIKNWNGLDYYDNDDISSNFSLNSNDPLYPTIDHKISIYNGFVNGIKPSIIGGIENLCITKRYINSTKRALTEEQFQLIKG